MQTNRGFITGKLFKVNDHKQVNYLVLTEDKEEIEIFPTKESKDLLRDYDNEDWVTFEGRYDTVRIPPYIFLKNAYLCGNSEYEDSFIVEGQVFQVQKNIVSKYEDEWNFLLVKMITDVGDKQYINRIKLSFKELENTNLVDSTKVWQFKVQRQGRQLVVLEILN